MKEGSSSESKSDSTSAFLLLVYETVKSKRLSVDCVRPKQCEGKAGKTTSRRKITYFIEFSVISIL